METFRLTVRTLSLPLALLAAGCIDTKARFHDFENAAQDASPSDAHIDAAPRLVPDPTGTFYVAFVTVGVDPDDSTITNLIWTIDAQKDAQNQPVSLDMTTHNLTIIPNGRTPIGTATPNHATISAGGEFELDFENFNLEGEANFTGGPLVLNMILDVTIESSDVLCGRVVGGMVTSPIPLSLVGSTMVGVRVPAGTTGSDLPAPLIACPDLTMPDGGLPDAGASDAATSDAAAHDAT